jgi:hypothetical protein
MLRSIGAVAAGYLVFVTSAVLLFQLSGQAPHEAAAAGFKIASVAWGAVSALVAGWLAARIAGRRPATHAAAVAALIALGATISLIMRSSDPKWSQVAAIAIMAPCAWIGGRLSRRSID